MIYFSVWPHRIEPNVIHHVYYFIPVVYNQKGPAGKESHSEIVEIVVNVEGIRDLILSSGVETASE
jgi:hypothetical protein